VNLFLGIQIPSGAMFFSEGFHEWEMLPLQKKLYNAEDKCHFNIVLMYRFAASISSQNFIF